MTDAPRTPGAPPLPLDGPPGAGPVTRLDAGPEVGPDDGPEVDPDVDPDAGSEVGHEVGREVGHEVGPDVGAEVGPDVGPDGLPRARLPIDPRIRERLVAVQRAQGRRRLKIIAGILGIFAMGALVLGLTRSPILAVRHVKVTGGVHTSRAAVLEVTALDRHPQMIDLSSGRLRHELMTLPWVASAQIHRRWPATVEIRLSERVPVAEVSGPKGQPAIVDREGRVLATGPGAVEAFASNGSGPSWSGPGSQAGGSGSAASLPVASGAAASGPAASAPGWLASGSVPNPPSSSSPGSGALPTVDGVGQAGPAGTFLASSGGAGAALSLVVALQPALPPASQYRLEAVQIRHDGMLQAKLMPNITVLFGSIDGLDAKLLTLRTLLERVGLKGAVTLDVRVPAAPVLTR